IGILIALLMPSLCFIPMYCSELILDIMMRMSSTVDSFPFFALKTGGLYPEIYGVYALFVLGLCVVAERYRKKYFFFGAAAAMLCIAGVIFAHSFIQKTEISFLDTTQSRRPYLRCESDGEGFIKQSKLKKSADGGVLMGIHCADNRVIIAGDFTESFRFSTTRNLVVPWLKTYPFCRVEAVFLPGGIGGDRRVLDTMAFYLRPKKIITVAPDYRDSLFLAGLAPEFLRRKIELIYGDTALTIGLAPQDTLFYKTGPVAMNNFYIRKKASITIAFGGAKIWFDDSLLVNDKHFTANGGMVVLADKKADGLFKSHYLTKAHPLYRFLGSKPSWPLEIEQ
ncbi:MAG: hypothetical protein PHC61_19120, partial [Chitinivibrionales bacterium]|nr:hypothetical protein [Chitinivibrionales bacterium]